MAKASQTRAKPAPAPGVESDVGTASPARQATFYLAGPPPQPGAACAGKRGAVASRVDAAMARYADGDGAAFGDLYDGLSPVLMAYLCRRTRNRETAEDLLQETFLRIHRHRGRYKPSNPVLPWAITIAVRLLMNRVRHDRNAQQLFVDGGAHEGTMNEGGPEDIAAALELAARIERELLQLPAPQREAFELVKGEGLPLKSAASRLETTEAGLKMRLFRIYDRLRPLLSECNDAGGRGPQR
jgi:RNA polymerase sigma-70 factor, ECF subfamily